MLVQNLPEELQSSVQVMLAHMRISDYLAVSHKKIYLLLNIAKRTQPETSNQVTF